MNPPSGSPLGIEPRDDLSHVRGPTDSPLSTATVASLLADTASRFADRPAVVFREQDVRWTWAQFKAEVDRFAAGLAALGLQAATGSASGRPIASSGWSRSSPPRASAWSWSTSIRPIACTNSNTRSMRRAAAPSSRPSG